jgi:signal transduction histidine kinase
LEQVRKASESLLKSATHLYGLIENLLEWSRMQRGLIPFEPESLQLLPLIDECLRESIEIAGKKGLAIRYEIPENSELFADRLMMKSVLRNLVTNAVKFTRKGGEIVISAARTDGKATVIAIKDNGIGMNEKMVEGLFKMDIATQRKGTNGEPSTGLGLNICRDFVERHGGMLRAESEEADPSSGKSGGSTFFITLPAKPG